VRFYANLASFLLHDAILGISIHFCLHWNLLVLRGPYTAKELGIGLVIYTSNSKTFIHGNGFERVTLLRE
jgi:hypothetical protein